MTDYWNLVDRIPRAHPTMRFLISFPSGGSGDSQRVTALSLKFPEKIAGYVVGPHPYAYGAIGARDTGFKLRKDISVAVLDVTQEAYARGRPETPYVLNRQDDFDAGLWERLYLVNLRSVGNAFLRVESTDWNQREDAVHNGLWFLVDCGWQVKAGVTAAERAAGQKEVLGAMERAREIKGVVEREKRYRALLSVPGAAEWPGAKGALESWRGVALEAADARREPLFKCTFLEMLKEHPLIKRSPEALKQVAAKLEDLKASESYRKEFAARQAVRAAAMRFSTDQSFGKDMAGLDGTIAAFEAAEKISEGTLAGKECKAWLEFLHRKRKELGAAAQKRNSTRSPVKR
jgi:hypothetical protein